MNDITKIQVDGEPESSYQLYPRNNEFAKRAGGGDGGSGTQSDWNQNDGTKPDYVKNRPFYTGDPVDMVSVEESTVEFTLSGGKYGAEFPTSFNAEFGQTYKVSWDGTIYECVCEEYNDRPLIGNQSIMGIGPDTGEPFIIFNESGLKETGWGSITTDTSSSHTISIRKFGTPIVKIDEKYLTKYTEVLPESFWVESTKRRLIQICEEFATGKVFAIKSELSLSGEFKASLLLHAYYYKTVGFYFVFLDHDKMTRISGVPNNWTENTFTIAWN